MTNEISSKVSYSAFFINLGRMRKYGKEIAPYSLATAITFVIVIIATTIAAIVVVVFRDRGNLSEPYQR